MSKRSNEPSEPQKHVSMLAWLTCRKGEVDQVRRRARCRLDTWKRVTRATRGPYQVSRRVPSVVAHLKVRHLSTERQGEETKAVNTHRHGTETEGKKGQDSGGSGNPRSNSRHTIRMEGRRAHGEKKENVNRGKGKERTRMRRHGTQRKRTQTTHTSA